MANLPVIGGDSGVWAQEIVTWLLADHAANGSHPFTPFTASDHGLLAWNYDPGLISSSILLTSGTVYLSRINIRYSMTVWNVGVDVSAAGATLTTGQNFAALINSTGTRVGVSADQSVNWSTGWTAANAAQPVPLTSGPFTCPAGYYWVAVLCNGTTTISLGRGGNGQSAAVNVGMTATTARAATNATGQTSIPAPIVPGSNVFTGSPFFCYLS